MPKPYPAEFRRSVLDLVRAGRTVTAVATARKRTAEALVLTGALNAGPGETAPRFPPTATGTDASPSTLAGTDRSTPTADR